MAQTAPFVALVPLSLIVACSTAPTQVRTPSESAFLQACRDATCDALVINLAAHPDDESARTLVYLRRRHGIRTVTIYSTCGGGGQNAIGREIGPALARLRTRETLAAARHTGTKVRWLGFADFGYSKTAAEAFKVWGRDKYLARLAAVVDELQPDLALTNHSPGGGHGHHRASVIALRELLAAKAKSGRTIPVYQRAGRRAKADVKFSVGDIDDTSGVSYARQASRGWRQHRTQGMMGSFSMGRRLTDRWVMVLPENGDGSDPMRLLGSVFDEKAFRATASALHMDVAALRAQFDAFDHPMPADKHVARARKLLPVMRRFASMVDDRMVKLRTARRIDALERVILEGSGISIKSSLANDRLANGSTGVIELQVKGDRPNGAAPTDLVASLDGKSTVGEAGVVRVPFGPLKNVDADSVAPSWFRPRLTFDLGGVQISREVPVRFTAVQRVALSWKRPVRFVPAHANGKMIEADLEIAWNGNEVLESSLRVQSPAGFDVKVDETAVRFPAKTTREKRRVSIRLPQKPLAGEESIVTVLDSGKSSLRLRPVDARPPQNLFVGLIRGPDDTLELALQDLGIRFELLDDKALPKADLARFSTIVIDIRAYRTRKDLSQQRDRILKWCGSGGRVLCFYHKSREWNKTDTRPLLAPYELIVGRGRVCEEDAKVTLLQPDHRLFTHPNRIVPADFDDWVQERGLNFPRKWDDRWTPLMQMSDTGEKPLKGALLYTEYEKGDYVYCSLALYRQLRLGHPGSARLLVNLLSQ